MAKDVCNVLVTSAGRRVQLVRFFQNAIANLRLSGRVLVIDMNPDWSAAARVADACFRAPHVNDASYEAFLLDFVQQQGIRLIVPTIDTELTLLSAMRDALGRLRCDVSVSDLALIKTCRDKRRSETWFRSIGFETPETLDRTQLRFPCFVKPFDGSLSVGARALLSPGMVSSDMLADETLIFMEWLSPEHYDEFTIDTYYDRRGVLKCLVPRKRVEVRGGEISKGVVVKGRTYDYLRERLARVEGARGCLTFQFFVARDLSRWVAVEVNPRFGGGYPLSYAAGANYPEWLIREYVLREDIPVFDAWCDGTAMVRYDAEIIFVVPAAG